MKWTRRFPNSTNNFDLILATPHELDPLRMNTLLDRIVEQTHRGLSLNSRAVAEFRQWFGQPGSPLPSEAYVSLSNWFMTNSGDRHSTVASGCEDLWDALFPCRPARRLSSPRAGRNRIMIPEEFQNFWRRLSGSQGDGGGSDNVSPLEPPNQPSSSASQAPEVSDVSQTDRLRAKFEKEGLHCEVEGSSRAVADFLRMVSRWEASSD